MKKISMLLVPYWLQHLEELDTEKQSIVLIIGVKLILASPTNKLL